MFRFWVLILACLSARVVHAKLEDVEAAEQKSQQNYIQRFKDFRQDKNVMGAPTDPFGNKISGRVKHVENADDKIQFESDLTQHDYEYEMPDEAGQKMKDAQPTQAKKDAFQVKDLQPGTSPHGAITKAQGSSQIERVTYQLHEQFAQAKSDAQKEAELKKQGIEYNGILKTQTIQVAQKKGGGNVTAATKPSDIKKKDISRDYLRDEAIPKIAEVGRASFQSIAQAAKDPDKRNDPQEMGNLSFYYDAAKSALGALWDRTVSKLGARRVYDAVDGGGKAKMWEDSPSCNDVAQDYLADRQSQTGKPPDKQDQQHAQEMKQQCEQVTATTYKQIAPKFDTASGGGGGPTPPPKLDFDGPDKEDKRERDYRVQLNLLEKVGRRASQVPSNWKYTDRDEKQLVVTDWDKNGQPAKTEALRMDEQTDRYNKQLQEAAQKVPDIKSRFPGLKLNEGQILGKEIQKNQKSAMEIVQLPASAYTPNFDPNMSKANRQINLPKSYSELQQQGAIP